MGEKQMQPIRTVYSKLPNTLTIPEEFQNISAEVIIWPLEPQNTESKKKRPFGLAKDIFEFPNTFFEPLPDQILSDFEAI
jgi:hypothetical protein